MKTGFHIFVALALLCMLLDDESLSQAQTTNGMNTLTHYSGSCIEIKPKEINLGAIPLDSSRTASFSIINCGDSLLVLRQIGFFLTCNDSSTNTTRDAGLVINPRDTLEIFAIAPIIPHDTISYCSKVIVRSNARAGDSVFTYRYRGVTAVPMFSALLHDFGEVFVGDTAQWSFTIKNIGRDPLRIDSFSFQMEQDFAVTPTNALIDSFSTQRFTLSFFPSRPGDSFNVMRMKKNSRYGDSTLVLHGRGVSGAGLRISPNPVLFDVCLGDTQIATVHLRNPGNETLEITEIISPDMRLLPSPLAGKIILASKGDTTLNIICKPDTVMNLELHFMIRSNSKLGDSTLAVRVIAQTGSLKIAPTPALRDTLFAVVGDSTEAPFYVDNIGDCPLFIENIEVVPDTAPFTVLWVRGDTLADAKQGAIYVKQGAVYVKYKPRETKIDSARIVVHAKYFDSTQEFTVRGRGLLDAFASIIPNTLDFGEVCVGKDSSLEVRMRNEGYKAFAIDAIIAKGSSAFSITPRPQANDPIPISARGEHRFTVTYAPKADAADSATLTFSAPTASGEKILSVKGKGLPVKLRADSLNISFGNTAVSEDSCQIIYWQNRSSQPITIIDIAIMPPEGFTASFEGETTIAPDSSFVLTVCFQPDTTKEYSAKLTLRHNTDCAEDVIALSGVGCAPMLESSFTEIIFDTIAYCQMDTVNLSVGIAGCAIWKLQSAVFNKGEAFKVCAFDSQATSGQRLRMKICFDPNGQRGAYVDTLFIRSNFYPDSLWKLAVRGIAEDIISPEIQNNTVCKTLRPGEAVLVSALATDNCDPAPLLKLFFRPSGAISKEDSIIIVSGIPTTIPGNLVTKRGLEYRFKAIDASGKEAFDPPWGYHSMPVRVEAPTDLIWLDSLAAQQRFFPLGATINSYRMISVPLNLDNKKAENVIVDDLPNYDEGKTWLLYDYFNGNYCEYTPTSQEKIRDFIPGRAFWLITTKFSETPEVGLGQSVTTSAKSAERCGIADYARYTLEPGWNLIGNPYPFEILRAECALANGDSLYDIWSYEVQPNESSARWKHKPTILEPWKGYAIRALKPTELIFATREAAGKAAPTYSQSKLATENDFQSWRINIEARAGAHADLDNYAGIREHALVGWDAADIFEPPAIGEYVAVYFPHRDWPEYPSDYAGDFRSPFAEGEVWEFEVKSNLKEKQISLTIKNAVSFPSHMSVYLYDKNRQALQDLRENANYTFNNLGELLPGRFELLIGTTDFVQHRTTAITNNLPDEIQLYQNFPNPFKQETIFSFYLPQAAPVTLKVFDVLGREVRVLSEGRVWEKGRQFVRWGGNNNANTRVTSGIYILSLQIKGFKIQQRTLLIR